jgi:hypothetical protein
MPSDTYIWRASAVPNSTNFQVIDLTTETSVALSFLCSTPCTSSLDTGDLTFSPVAAPEPISVGLMVIGMGLVLVMRKRISQALIGRITGHI